MPGLFSRGDGRPLDAIEHTLGVMFTHVTTCLHLAARALFGDQPVADVAADLRGTDRQVNLLEQEVRRALLVHVAVAGAADGPAMLTYMSLVKDIERIGDYAKNLLELAELGVDLSRGEDADELRRDFADVVELVPRAATAFAERDEAMSQELLADVESLRERCNARVAAAVTSDEPGHQAVPRALYHRYLKRVVAHTGNVLTGVVMPLDLLDFFDEDVEDRVPGAPDEGNR